MRDIQLQDIIEMPIPRTDTPGLAFEPPFESERKQVQILYIPIRPNHPWVVREVLNGRKWRVHTDGNMTIHG